MKFAHFADVHIGSWRDPKLSDLSTLAFEKAVNYCIKEQVDFILIAGDIFNTSLPPIDKLKSVVIKLKELKQNDIPVYIVAGSHDFSPSGKTMLDVLEEAGLFINVVKGEVDNNQLKLNFTTDQKTGAKITGMIGKKGMLERSHYEALDRNSLENESGYKIFMFHTALTELKPKEMEKMDSAPISYLPRNFNYYAGGHVHIIKHMNMDGYNNITYPGALFPANFKELEEFKHGGMYIVEDNNVTWHPIKVMDVQSINLDCNHKSPQYIEEELKHNIKDRDFTDTIVTIRLKGTLESGRISDINFKEIVENLHEHNAYFVMKNTNALKTKEFEEIKINSNSTIDIEESIIKEHLGQVTVGIIPEKEQELTTALINALDLEKQEGEKVNEYEVRVKAGVKGVLSSILE